ncbi:MAG: hypothetical protein A3J38_06600 [Gammaproteobacteria bacterium RIFCSPHIGHO2_12_FULL_45_9]|nr:MAG: hypothetical protein A3J38_06600 [Gammaproteobacteria bacterium RIFCSPHIGHO2_12_FULL_45_9]
MRRLFTLFLILFLSLWVGTQISHHQGYVWIAYGSHSIQMTVWFTVLALFIVFVGGYVLWWLFNTVLGLKGRISAWHHHHTLEKGRTLTDQGLCELAEGQFELAECALVRAAPKITHPLINYLGAARAAHAQGAFERRDDYLHAAHVAAPDAEMAIGLTQAELQIHRKQWEQAAATLHRLREQDPKHPRVIRQLIEVSIEFRDTETLQALLPLWQRTRHSHSVLISRLERQAYEVLIRHTAPDELTALWRTFAARIQADPALRLQYVTELAQHDPDTAAETIERIVTSLIHEPVSTRDHEVLTALWQVYSTFPPTSRRLQHTDQWALHFPQHADILRCAGILYMKEHFFGKARDYLTDSLRIEPHAHTAFALAQTLEALQETEAALAAYRQGAALTTAGILT